MKEIIFKYMKEHGFGEFNPKAVLLIWTACCTTVCQIMLWHGRNR